MDGCVRRGGERYAAAPSGVAGPAIAAFDVGESDRMTATAAAARGVVGFPLAPAEAPAVPDDGVAGDLLECAKDALVDGEVPVLVLVGGLLVVGLGDVLDRVALVELPALFDLAEHLLGGDLRRGLFHRRPFLGWVGYDERIEMPGPRSWRAGLSGHTGQNWMPALTMAFASGASSIA